MQLILSAQTGLISFCGIYYMGLKNKSECISLPVSKATLPYVNVQQMIILRSLEKADDACYLLHLQTLHAATPQIDSYFCISLFHVHTVQPDQLSAFDEMSASQTNTNQGSGSSN